MQHPWNVPPLPARGDASQEIVFESVGRALTSWELFEHDLAAIYAALIGPGVGTWIATRAYGSVLTFRGRSDMVKAAAAAHFAKTPQNTIYTELNNLLNHADNYSPRRNEIAHAVVRGYTDLVLFESPKTGFVLVPSDYATNKIQIKIFEISLLPVIGAPATSVVRYTLPKYAYSSKEINYFSDRFMELSSRAATVGESIVKLYYAPSSQPPSP